MIYYFLAFAFVCILFYYLYRKVDTPEDNNTLRDCVCYLLTLLIIFISVAYYDYANVTCKDQGGVLVRGAVLYSCVARVEKVRVRRSI